MKLSTHPVSLIAATLLLTLSHTALADTLNTVTFTLQNNSSHQITGFRWSGIMPTGMCTFTPSSLVCTSDPTGRMIISGTFIYDNNTGTTSAPLSINVQTNGEGQASIGSTYPLPIVNMMITQPTWFSNNFQDTIIFTDASAVKR